MGLAINETLRLDGGYVPSTGTTRNIGDVPYKLNEVARYFSDRSLMTHGGRFHFAGAFKDAWETTKDREPEEMEFRREMITAASDLFYTLTIKKNDWIGIGDEYKVGKDRRRDITFLSDGFAYNALFSARRLETDAPILVINIKRTNSDKEMQIRIGCDMCEGDRSNKSGRQPHLDIADINPGPKKNNNWFRHRKLNNVWRTGKDMGKFINHLLDQTISKRATTIQIQEERAEQHNNRVFEPVGITAPFFVPRAWLN